MKKVRFESPTKVFLPRMDERECHSPRPFIEKQAPSFAPFAPDYNHYQRLIYSDDPVRRYESSDSSPYPAANKTPINTEKSDWMPSNELDLSMLDSGDEPRMLRKPHFFKPNIGERETPQVLSPIENVIPPNVLSKDNSFFIRRENIDKYRLDADPLHKQLTKLCLDKENDPSAKKVEIMRTGVKNPTPPDLHEKINSIAPFNSGASDCSCHHCVKVLQSTSPHYVEILPRIQTPYHNVHSSVNGGLNQWHCCKPTPQESFHCELQVQNSRKTCHCCHIQNFPLSKPQNAVDKKTWAIEKFEQSKKNECTDVEKQMNVTKEKREPTVADLFKIIKLQNEQLQLLQEKVDKFISSSQTQNVQSNHPVQNYTTEHVALQTIDSDEHKISIGVMTSFEMVRTSTVINKEILKQTNKNAQIQCNRSQISIKEVVSKSQPVNLNFLDGITPMTKTQSDVQTNEDESFDNRTRNAFQQSENVNDEKTLNELSLYNVQVDNATTPLISPEQTLYLDVRDYSDSESGSDDQSNVGWTYYNKVMTHVNGMLQDSDMPSSASALYRNTRQQCAQMQIEKTNISVTKRVKFGDDPLGIHQPHIYAGSTVATDTSLKMKQLAAKYLQITPQLPQRPAAKPTPIDMSFATRNYMEKHKLLQGSSRSPPAAEMPRFLDITALKQQQHNKLL